MTAPQALMSLFVGFTVKGRHDYHAHIARWANLAKRLGQHFFLPIPLRERLEHAIKGCLFGFRIQTTGHLALRYHLDSAEPTMEVRALFRLDSLKPVGNLIDGGNSERSCLGEADLARPTTPGAANFFDPMVGHKDSSVLENLANHPHRDCSIMDPKENKFRLLTVETGQYGRAEIRSALPWSFGTYLKNE